MDTRTLKDLVMETTFDDVAEVLVREYPEDWKACGRGRGFKKVFNELQEKEPASSDGTKIIIEYVLREYDDHTELNESFHDVGGIDVTGERLALDYTPWAIWLGMEIHPRTLRDYTVPEIVAHCLWEMTFVSFDEREIEKQWHELMGIAKKMREE